MQAWHIRAQVVRDSHMWHYRRVQMCRSQTARALRACASLAPQVSSHVWLGSFICVTWLVCMCYMTYSSVCHDLFICVTWLIWHDSFVCVASLIHMCDMTHSCVCHDSYAGHNSSIDAFICVTWLIWPDSFMSHCQKNRIKKMRPRDCSLAFSVFFFPRAHESRHTYDWLISHQLVMGWPWSVESNKL